jgi:hypothetical protein
MANKLAEEWKKLPKWGKAAIIIGGAGGVYYAWRVHENAKAAAAASTSSTDSTGSSSYDQQTDPITGLTYGEDISEYGSVQAADTAVQQQDSQEAGLNGAYDTGYGYSGGGGAGYYSYGESGGTTTGTTTITTNAQWVSEVANGLEQLGYSSANVTAALGLYLANLPMSSSQAAIISTALAEYGPPPTGSYTVNLSSSTSGAGTATTGNTGSTGSTSSSNTTGSSSNGSTGSTGSTTSSSSTSATHAPIDPPEGVTVSNSGDNVTFKWPSVGGATKYSIDITSNGANLWSSQSLTGNSVTVGIHSHPSFQWSMASGNSAGWSPSDGWHTYTMKS